MSKKKHSKNEPTAIPGARLSLGIVARQTFDAS